MYTCMCTDVHICSDVIQHTHAHTHDILIIYLNSVYGTYTVRVTFGGGGGGALMSSNLGYRTCERSMHFDSRVCVVCVGKVGKCPIFGVGRQHW